MQDANVSKVGSKLSPNASGVRLPSEDGSATPDPAGEPPNRIPTSSARMTPDVLTLVELDQNEIDRIARATPGGVGNVQDIYPLSPLQEGMLFHRLLEQSDTYVLSTLFELESHAQVHLLINALQKVQDRHDILRTCVLWERLRQPIQVVHRSVALPIEKLVLAPDRDAIEQLKEQMMPGRQRLDIRKAPIALLQIAGDPLGAHWYAVLHVHHLVCDHQSLKLITSEVLTCLDGRDLNLPPAVPFRDYVAQGIAHARTTEAKAFFGSQLGDVEEPTAPFGLLGLHGDGTEIDETRQPLDPVLSTRIRATAERLGVSAARLFHAAWALVVSRTSGRDDVVFGSILSTVRRSRTQGPRALGMAINTVPLRLRLQGLTALELVQQTDRELVEALEYRDTPLTLAQSCSRVPSGTPLFTSLLNCRHSSAPPAQGLDDSRVRVLYQGEACANYPLALTVDDFGEKFALIAHADRRIGPDRVILHFCTALLSLVESLETEPQTASLALQVLPESERQTVLEEFNPPRVEPPHDGVLHELFEQQVRRTPQAIAVAQAGYSLTFQELNQRANQLARYLRRKGVGPDQLVALCVGRSIDAIVAVLGIWKAGAAYLPLDPEYPSERLLYMLEDAEAKVLLARQEFKTALPDTQADVITLDDDWPLIACEDDTDLDPMLRLGRLDALAYVIYTSGSTGQPKGVMVEHRNVVNLWIGLERLYAQSRPCQRVGLNASLNFDASVQQLVQLLSGRTVYVIPQAARRDASILLNLLLSHRIQGIDCTPSQLKSWIAAGLNTPNRYPLNMVLVGGEPIEADLWRTLATCTEIDFYNVYGPTECTVDATAAPLRSDISNPHIGRPMEGRRVYILDRHGEPVPVGVTGEIHIGGAGIARGYLNRPDLTAQRFITDPFLAPLARTYKTGDLARWRHDGVIEYLGRNDTQVKIRGYRIELDEITTHLLRHGLIKDAAVIAREDVPGDKRLVAYAVLHSHADSEAAASADALRAYLKGRLPEHMVPSAVVILESLPLTTNGKLDHRALPAPAHSAYTSRAYEAPLGSFEEALSEVWQSLLRVEKVGREDNFFELGGHSLIATRVFSRVRERFHVELPLKAIFDEPTLRGLAARISLEARRVTEEDSLRTSEIARDLRTRISEMDEAAVLARIAQLEKELSSTDVPLTHDEAAHDGAHGAQSV